MSNIRKRVESGVSLEEAIDLTLDEMPDDYIIKSLLIGNRAEVKLMVITEYDEQKHIRTLRKEGRDNLAALLAILEDEGRIEEMEKCIRDQTFREKMLAEYELDE